jgi:biopolymer transport protein ExbD
VAISTGESGGVNANINVTPMIDVMLVLLIIFMIVTPLISAGFTAVMPSGANVETQAEEDNEVTLGLDNQGNYFLNGAPVDPATVEQELTAIFSARTEDFRLFFKADAGLPYSKIQEAVEMGRRAGAAVLVAVADRAGGMLGEMEEEN